MSETNTPRQKILVLASTFPRWQGDTMPPFVYELSRRLTQQFDVHLLAPSYPGAASAEEMDGIHVHRFRYFFRRWEKLAGGDGILPTLKHNRVYYLVVPFFILGEYLVARRLIKQLKPSVIHAHWIIPQGFVTWLLNLTTPINYVVTSHGSDIFGLQGVGLTKIKRWVLKSAKITTVVSHAIKNEVINNIDSTIQVQVIPMGVDSALFSPKKHDDSLRQRYGIKGPFLLFVGRLNEQKGVSYLIDAMPKVLERYATARLMIVGKGPLDAKLKAQAESLGISNQLIFTGAIPNNELPSYYATADIFIGPSIRAKSGITEGFGLTFVEAGMCGAWLIGSNVGGVSDIIQEGVNGNLVEEKNTPQIASAIINALEKGKSATLGRESTFKSFDWDVIAAKYAQCLNQATQEGQENETTYSN